MFLFESYCLQPPLVYLLPYLRTFPLLPSSYRQQPSLHPPLFKITPRFRRYSVLQFHIILTFTLLVYKYKNRGTTGTYGSCTRYSTDTEAQIYSSTRNRNRRCVARPSSSVRISGSEAIILAEPCTKLACACWLAGDTFGERFARSLSRSTNRT